MKEYKTKKYNYYRNENSRYNTVNNCSISDYENSNQTIYNSYQNQPGKKFMEVVTSNNYNIPENSKMVEILSKINLDALPLSSLLSNVERYRIKMNKSCDTKYKNQNIKNKNINMYNCNTGNFRSKSKDININNYNETINLINKNNQILTNTPSTKNNAKIFYDKYENYDNENYFKKYNNKNEILAIAKKKVDAEENNNKNQKINNRFRYSSKYCILKNRNNNIKNEKYPIYTNNAYRSIIKLQSFWRGYQLRKKQVIKLQNTTKGFLLLESSISNIIYKLRKYILLELLTILGENLRKCKEIENQNKQMEYRYKKNNVYIKNVIKNIYNEYNSEEKKIKNITNNNENLLYRGKKNNLFIKENNPNSFKLKKKLDSNAGEKCNIYNFDNNNNNDNDFIKNFDLSSERELKKNNNNFNFRYNFNIETKLQKKNKLAENNSKSDKNNKNDLLCKKMKIEEFFSFIKKKCHSSYYKEIKEKLIKLGEANLLKKKIDVLKKIIKINNNKIIKIFFEKYKQKILIEKVREKLLSKDIENDKTTEKEINTNIPSNNDSNLLESTKKYEKFENIIIINNNENSENNKINNGQQITNNIISFSDKKESGSQNKFNSTNYNRVNCNKFNINANSSENPVILKTNSININHDYNKLQSSNIARENSFENGIRKKYLRVKYDKKTNFTPKNSSFESFGHSDITPKRMKIKNVAVMTPNKYFFTLMSNNGNDKSNTEKIKCVDNNFAKKLFSIMKKLENKNILNKIFSYWKKCCEK